MKLIVAIMFAALGLSSQPALANNFYLNYDYGSDAANGSSTATAWKTWDKIRSYGVATNYQPGDTISLLNGDTWTQDVSYWNALGNGGTNTPIILGSWGTSSTRPIIEAIPGADYCISFRNMSYWTIQNIMFANADWACILLLPESSNVTNIKVLNCEVTSNVIPFHYVRVGNTGIQEITNVEFGAVTIHGTSTWYPGNVDLLNFERVKSGVWVHDCFGYIGSSVGSLSDIAGGDGHIFEYNKAHNAGNLVKFHGQQYALTNATGRYSLLYDVPQGDSINNIGIIMEEMQDSYVYNNTAYMGTSSVAAGQVWDKPENIGHTKNLVIQNNIFYGSRLSEAAFKISGTTTQSQFNGSTTCNHNLYYQTNGSAIKLEYEKVAINNGSGSSAWQADHPGDLFVDPLFVNPAADDYHLAWNSPCIDAGIAVNATHTQSLDLDKNPIYGTPDIGCYEYQPPFTIGTDAIDTTGTIRMYSNGKYRYKTGTSSGTLASLDIYQAAGRLSGTYSQWLDLSFTSWTANKKAWTETPGYGTNTRHVVSGLTNGASYAVQVDGATQTTKIASGGSISFDQVLGASPVDFEVNLTSGVEVTASGGGSVSASGSGSIVCGAANESIPVVYGAGWNADGLTLHQLGQENGRAVSYRFRAEQTEMAYGARVYLVFTGGGYYMGDGGQVLLQLQTDDGTANHLPSGTVLASSLVTDPMNQWNRLFSFASPVQLQKGVLYHLVFTDPAPDPINNWVSLDLLYNSKGTPNMQPGISDTDLACIWKRNSASNWSMYYYATPIYCLYYNDGTFQGQGYIDALSISGATTISGANKARETFTVSGSNREVSKVSVRLKKTGSPGDLTVRLEYSNGTLIEEGTISASLISTSYNWVTYTFTRRRTLSSGSSYNLVLSAPAGDSYTTFPITDGVSGGFDCPEIYKDGHFQIISNSQWVNFGNKTDADMQFYFK